MSLIVAVRFFNTHCITTWLPGGEKFEDIRIPGCDRQTDKPIAKHRARAVKIYLKADCRRNSLPADCLP